jgi:dTDP-4-amino-4,6-dideoxygalactose transaminase
MVVPYYDLRQQYARLRDEVLGVLDRVCRNSAFILGEEVARFEEEFAAYCEARFCVALNSGTSALQLAVAAAGVGPGDEVITTPNSFIATAWAITYAGATPVFVDIDPATANLDPRLVEAAITPRTKALLPVHLYGRPAPMDAFAALAAKHGLALIEDAAQAHGARYCGRRVGNFGQSAAFSFYPSKNLGAYGEAGALVTNDDAVADLARSLRNHGESARYVHERVGYNYRMEGFQGAILRVKLKHLDAWTARRREICARYRELLAGARVDLLSEDPALQSAHHLFVVYVDERDRVRQELEARGVGTAVHYPTPIHLQKAYAGLGYRAGSFPHAERACRRVLCLPLFPELTDAQVEYVASSLKAITS